MAGKRSEAGGGKTKRLPFQIAEVLKGASGQGLSQQGIAEELAGRYGADVHRDTVRANLELLKEYFPEVRREERPPHVIWSWRESEPEPLFEESQARYLADSVIAARRIPLREKAALVDAVMGNAYGGRLPWDDVLSNFSMIDETSAVNPKYLYTVETLAECMREGKWVAFRFGGVDRHGSFERALPEEGETGPVKPLALVAANGGYYLRCRFPGKEKEYHYRVDLIHDARAVEPEGGTGTPPIPMNMDRYRDDHPLMFTNPVKVTVAVNDTYPSRLHFFDAFGSRPKLKREEDGRLVYEVKANPTAARILAMQLADDIEVLSPQEVRDAVAGKAAELAGRYAAASEGAAE